MKAAGFTLIEMLFVTALSSALAIGCLSFVKVQLHMANQIHLDIQQEHDWSQVVIRVQQSLDRAIQLGSSDSIVLDDHSLVVVLEADDHTANCFGTPVQEFSMLRERFYLSGDRFMCRSEYTDIDGQSKRDTQSISNDIVSINWSMQQIKSCASLISLQLHQKHRDEARLYQWVIPCLLPEELNSEVVHASQ